MEKACKKFSWLIIVSMVVVVVGTVFGILAALSITNPDLVFFKWVVLAISLILGIMLTISNVIAFLSMRQGNVKSVLLALGKNTKFQSTGPAATLVLAIIGLATLGIQQGKDVGGSMVFVIVSYIVAAFVLGLNSNSLRAYRKDKETYDYMAVTSFLSAAALLVFGIGASIAMFNIPSIGNNNHFVGYLETFAILFTLADLLAFIVLGIAAIVAKKNAPKLSMADADAAKLDDLNASINKLAQATSQQQTAPSSANDKIAQLREYKKLLDEGVITKEEFEQKKKELL